MSLNNGAQDLSRPIKCAKNNRLCRESCTSSCNTGIPVTVAKGLPMPRTVEHYQANAIRDQELILEQRDEIGRLNTRLNKLEQKTQSPRQVLHPQHGVCRLGIYRNTASDNLFYSECKWDTAKNRVKPHRVWLDDAGLINVEMQEANNV